MSRTSRFAGSPDPQRFIVDNLPLARAGAVPELSLHLANPRSGLWRLAGAGRPQLPPYWAYQWAGGTALARFVLDRPRNVAGCRVLDLGCGGGLVAIAAARAGAREVCAVDIDPLATIACELNAAANAALVSIQVADILDLPPPKVDVVLVGDVFYEPLLAGRAMAFLGRCHAAGIAALVGDPGRRSLPLADLRLLAEVPVPDFGGAEGGVVQGAVFAFGGAPDPAANAAWCRGRG